MKKIFIFLILGMFLINLIGASCPDGEDCIGTIKPHNSIEIYQTCNNCTYGNFTKVKYPNKTTFLSNILATQDGTYFYTEILGGNNSVLGEYEYCYDLGNAAEKETGCLNYLVTPSGKDFDTGQAIGGIGIFIGVLAVAVVFMFIGSKLSKEDKTLPVGFFFTVMAVILAIYSLYLGWVFSNDILQHEIISQGLQVLFVVVVWSSVGMAIIFFSLMLIAFIREFGKVLKKKKFGEDFNPIDDVYE